MVEQVEEGQVHRRSHNRGARGGAKASEAARVRDDVRDAVSPMPIAPSASRTFRSPRSDVFGEPAAHVVICSGHRAKRSLGPTEDLEKADVKARQAFQPHLNNARHEPSVFAQVLLHGAPDELKDDPDPDRIEGLGFVTCASRHRRQCCTHASLALIQPTGRCLSKNCGGDVAGTWTGHTRA